MIANSKEEVNEIFEEFVKLITEPWIAVQKPRPGRYKPFWNARLDTLAKKRTRLYKRARRTNEASHWDEYSTLDKEIKRITRKEKQKRFQRFAQDASEASANTQQTLINRITSAKRRITSRQTIVGHNLDRSEFTEHLANTTRATKEVEYKKERFTSPQEDKEILVDIIKRLPNGKAPGVDLIVPEAMKEHPDNHAAFMLEFWKLCGRIGSIPQRWLTTNVVPIHTPSNYRPISLLVQPRKTIESMLDKLNR